MRDKLNVYISTRPKSLARVLLPIMREYLSSEKGQKDVAECQQSQLNKLSNNKESR